MKSTLWLAWKLWWTRQSLFGGTAPLSLFGLVLGVASLVASMAVMSGFESSLKSAMADVTGHVTLIKRSKFQEPASELEAKIKKLEPTLVAAMRFTYLEAIVAGHGQVLGVMIQGVDPEKVRSVLNYETRLLSGKLEFSKDQQDGGVLIGKGIAQKLNLKIGDHFKVIVPVTQDMDPTRFSRQLGSFVVRGILDLGKHDWNERFILADLASTQKLAQVPEDKYSGLILKFSDIDHSRSAAFHLTQELGGPYHLRDWRDLNENLFDAVKYERVVIFFVVLVIVIVSAFNVSSTLLVNVVRRFSDIAILKALGMSKKQIMRIYSFQGLLLGTLGLILGIILGLILCLLFSFYQSRLGLISGEVYRLDSIQVEVRFMDLLIVSVSTLLICFLATLAPALRGAKLDPVKGLRYG